MDNTWATPLFFSPHAHGVDMAVEAGTKYLSGHADLLLGLVSANETWFERLHRTVELMAIPPGPEDVFLALRGLRTMDLRLREAERQGLALARWLSDRPEVLRVIHPALPDHPGHGLWKRDFSGSSGLFSIVLKPASEAAVAAFLDGLELFGLGYSWGGFESLAVPFDCTAYRTATRFAPGGPTVRFSVGLEDIEDLKEDLDRGFARLRAAADRQASSFETPALRVLRMRGKAFETRPTPLMLRSIAQRCVSKHEGLQYRRGSCAPSSSTPTPPPTTRSRS